MNDSNAVQLKDILDTTVKLSAVAISFGFIISITYDFGYFMAFDLSFSDIPSTINDHVRNSLICLPYSVATIAVWLGIKFIGDVKEHIKSQAVSCELKPKTRSWPSFIKLSNYHLAILNSLLGIIIYILLGNQMPLGLIVLFFWFIFYDIILVIIIKVYDLKKLSTHAILLVVFVPIFLSLVLLKGNETSKKDKLSNLITNKIYLKNNSVVSVSSIRFFDKFAFVVIPTTKQPTFIQLSEIFKVEQVAKKGGGFKGIIDYFGYELGEKEFNGVKSKH